MIILHWSLGQSWPKEQLNEIGLNDINGYHSAVTIYYHVIIIITDYIEVGSDLEPARFEPTTFWSWSEQAANSAVLIYSALAVFTSSWQTCFPTCFPLRQDEAQK